MTTTPCTSVAKSHWPRHAALWKHFGPPLRPYAQDVKHAAEVCAGMGLAAPRMLLLGVTPDYATMPLPKHTVFTAVDRCPAMIEHVWPKALVPPSFRAVEGLWTALPLADGSQDIVIGDGVTTVLSAWSDAHALFEELHRVTHAGSRVLLRLFIKPATPDSVERIVSDLAAGRIPGLHAFKLRLLMLLQRSLGQGLKLQQAWQAWRTLRDEHAALIAQQAWTAGEIETIEAYATSGDTYWFPSMAEINATFGACFEVEQVLYSNHEMGDRCPLFVLRRRP
jgi:SAM-dependent methyltransferase